MTEPLISMGPEQPKAKKKPFIPSLKTGSLGLSTLMKENGKTQEEIDVENQVKANKFTCDESA